MVKTLLLKHYNYIKIKKIFMMYEIDCKGKIYHLKPLLKRVLKTNEKLTD